MKKTRIIVMALAFLAVLTQCKKEQVTPANDSEAVAITLDIKGNGGTRVDVNTGTGAVTYQNGDVIYVASGCKYVGTLTHDGTRFAGTITDPTVGEPLHFYFLGNVTPAETLTAGTTQTCSVVISDQTQRLPVIEYAPSDQNYTGGANNFTAMLLNKCALVKFNVTTSSEAATCITGFNNKVTVNFSDNTLTPSQEGNGVISLPAGSGEKWAILLPQNAMEAGAMGSAYSADGVYRGRHGAVPAINNNGYLTVGIDVTITSDAPIGAICGKFTINADGDQVYFSQGNLQYQASTNTWRFAENQWDLIVTPEDMTSFYDDYGYIRYYADATSQYSPTSDAWIDLFCWGTSGYNHGAICYQPWDTNMVNSDYYAYGNSSYNLFDQTGQADWGYNAISNGGNQENQWRTLTASECEYIFNSRTGIRYAKAKVNGVNGLILLPDGWSSSTYNLNNTNQNTASFNTNIISATQWDYLEHNGAVFLPAAGYRGDFGPEPLPAAVEGVGSMGCYWLSTRETDKSFGDSYINIVANGSFRANGISVRLVRNVQ